MRKTAKESGIQIQVATNRQFSKNVHFYKTGKKKTSRVINLKRKTTWYVRIRYYNKQGFSAWSNIRKVSK